MKKLAFIPAWALPFVAFAQADQTTTTDLSKLAGVITSIIDIVIPIILGLSVLVIIWGIFTMITSAGDEEKRKSGQGYIIWGVIALFIMVSIWGLVRILVNTFDLDTSAVTPPDVVPIREGGSDS